MQHNGTINHGKNPFRRLSTEHVCTLSSGKESISSFLTWCWGMSGFESVGVDGRELRLYVTAPESRSHPGVLLLHPWWGLNTFMQDVCDRLADAGFLVMAPDLYHGTVATTIEEADTIESNLDGDRVVVDIAAALDQLRDHPRLAAGLGMVGFSMGVYYGLKVLQDRPTDFDAAVLFYGTSDGEFAGTTTSFLGHFAENDSFETTDDVKSLRIRLGTGDGSVTFHTYSRTEH